MVTYIDGRVARDRARLERYRIILADGRFFVTTLQCSARIFRVVNTVSHHATSTRA